MHIIITLAGHSRRFKEKGFNIPKFLIDIDGAPMIKHVVHMFDPHDTFHFVANEDQIRDHPEIPVLLASLAKKTHLTVIAPHEMGPTWTALQAKNVPSDAEVIVSYCDFVVSWDYRLFHRQVYGFDGAIPAFRGFHPASFGQTHFAYMRVNERKEMLELREKESFTAQRHEEYASAGIYFFRTWHLFKTYAQRSMREGFGKLKEGYVSLLFNPMVEDGLRVKVTEVEKFICWGTPEDLEQHYFWSHYFRTSPRPAFKPVQKRKQINLLPMAGKGGRFKEYGYRVGKPLIIVRDQPMALTACRSFPAADHWVFLARADDLARHPLEKAIIPAFPDSTVIPVVKDTTGQAATCLLAEAEMNPEASLLIASCDYETLYDSSAWQRLVDDESIDAVIWTYRMKSALAKNPLAFAYCITGDDGISVTRIVEKQTISKDPWKDPLLLGTLWFRRAADFIWTAKTAVERDMTVNGEHYVANSMNLLLEKGKKIVIFDIEQWISFGDPFELNVLNYWEDYFAIATQFENALNPFGGAVKEIA